jgi:hypothetical protein
MTPETKELIDSAIGIVCTQAKLDPQSSIAIDDMQARPSLPLQSPEAQAGADRAQRLLPVAKSLMIESLRQLVVEYGLDKSPRFEARFRQATARVNAVKRVRPDMESRDNASVFLSKPHVITFGTIFLAGLRSDEGMISVLAHELMHIADGDNDSLRPLVSAVGNRASDLTGLDIRGQRELLLRAHQVTNRSLDVWRDPFNTTALSRTKATMIICRHATRLGRCWR